MLGGVAVQIVHETHSITTDNESGLATGWQLGRLSEQGRRLARQLGERRRNDGLAAVVTSDLARAIETAQLAFADTDIPIYHDERLRECDYGELTGMSAALLARLRRQHIDVPFPGGESYRDVVERTRELSRRCASRWAGRRIVVIAHSANRWALDHLLDGTALEDLLEEPFSWQAGWEYRLTTGGTLGQAAHASSE
jgi:broad specificity phosphatase PhoE